MQIRCIGMSCYFCFYFQKCKYFYLVSCLLFIIQLLFKLHKFMSMFKIRRKYIDVAHQKEFIDFKYKGGTDSISYEYVWSPLAQFFLNFLPIWLAPNMITFSSFIVIAITHLLFMFCGSNQNGVSNWKLIMMAVAIFIYQNLDNIDGKQARRTKTGSPLGMMFDHGVDSLCSFMLALQFLEIIRMTNFNIIILVLFVFIMLPFFSALWNQYSTGNFKLGRVNPVDEGLPSLAIGALLFLFIPTDHLSDFHIFAPLNVQILAGLGVLLIVLLISMNKNIIKSAIRQKSDVLQVLSLPILTGTALTLGHLMNKNLYFNQNGLQVSYSLLFFWSRNMIEIQLYYVSGQKFKVYNRGTNIFLFLLLGFLFYGNSLIQLGVTPQLYFWFATFINSVVFFEFVINVLKQGSQILGINILTIKPKQS